MIERHEWPHHREERFARSRAIRRQEASDARGREIDAHLAHVWRQQRVAEVCAWLQGFGAMLLVGVLAAVLS